jgi:hypothetical protein
MRRQAAAAVIVLAVVVVISAAALLGQKSDDEEAREAATTPRPLPALAPVHRPDAPERRCLRSVIDDWYSDGIVDRSYRMGCYAAALGALPTSPRDYSSVYDDLRRAYELAARSSIVDEREAVFRVLGLGSPAAEIEAVLGRGEADGGFAPVGSLPAEVAVPLALPNPPGVRERPRLLRYPDRAFLLARGRAFAMMITAERARTRQGVEIGDAIAKVRTTYGKADCYRAPGGERPGIGVITYPVCRVRIAPKRYLSFGGDPIRSFTFFSREKP